jgi:hypothetical protein
MNSANAKVDYMHNHDKAEAKVNARHEKEEEDKDRAEKEASEKKEAEKKGVKYEAPKHDEPEKKVQVHERISDVINAAKEQV